MTHTRIARHRQGKGESAVTTYNWPMLPTFFAERLTEDQFERVVEKRIDAADALLMSGKVSQEDYDTRMWQINTWADDMYKAGRIKPSAWA